MPGKCEQCGAELTDSSGAVSSCPRCSDELLPPTAKKKNKGGDSVKSPVAPPVTAPPVAAPPETASPPIQSAPPVSPPPVSAPPVQAPPKSGSAAKPPVASPPLSQSKVTPPSPGEPPVANHSKPDPPATSVNEPPEAYSAQPPALGKSKAAAKKSVAKSDSSESLLPPSVQSKKPTDVVEAKIESEVDSLLPQKSTTDDRKEDRLLPESSKEESVEPIMPPKAHKPSETDTSDGDENEPREVLEGDLNEVGIQESEKVVLPDGQGGFVEVSERRTTVEYRGAKIELSRLKRGEKEASRSLRNFVVMTFCFLLLVTLMILLGWFIGQD